MTHPEHSFTAPPFQTLFEHAELDPAHMEHAIDTATVVLARNSLSVLWRAVVIDQTQILPTPFISTKAGELSQSLDSSDQGISNDFSKIPSREERHFQRDPAITIIFEIIDCADEIRAIQDTEEFSTRAREEFGLNGSKVERLAGKIVSAVLSPLEILKRQKDKPKRSHLPLSKEGEAFNAQVDRLSRSKRIACAIVGGIAVAFAAHISHETDMPLRYSGAYELVTEEMMAAPNTKAWQNFDACFLDTAYGLIVGAGISTGIRGRARIGLARETAKYIVNMKLHKTPDIDQDTK